MDQLRRALRKAAPLIAVCIVTVGVVYVMFGKAERVTTPTFSGGSVPEGSASASSVATAASVLVDSGGPPVPPASTNVASEAPGVSAPPPTLVKVAVIGDTYTAPSGFGGDGVHNWTSIMAGMLEDSGYNVELTVDATPGSGYVRTGPSGTNFVDQIGRTVASDTSLVVVFGSRYDDGIIPREQVGSTANTAIEKIRSIAPEAAILVIGPAWPDNTLPGYIAGIEWNLKATAVADHATFLDPIADQWFVGQSALIGSDGVSPTDAGHAYMAERIEPAAVALLPARG